MKHTFSFTHTVHGLTSEAFKRILANEAFHLGLAKHLNGDGLEVLTLQLSSTSATFGRRYPLNAKLPGPLQKLASDNLTITRTDIWDIERLVCDCNFELNLPLKMALRLTAQAGVQQLHLQHDWSVSVNIPLIGKSLAGMVEQDIRSQAQKELVAFDQYCQAFQA